MRGSGAEIEKAAWRKRHAAFFRRRGLPREIRHAAALGALQARGEWTGFACQADWAAHAGVALAWMREVFLQSYLFVGFPRAIEALQILNREMRGHLHEGTFWREEDRPDLDSCRARGEVLCARIYGPHYAALLTVMGRTHPDLAAWMVEEGYGKVLSRPHPQVDARIRELCVIPQLVALEAWPQLRSHVAGARRVGADPVEITEALRTALRMAGGGGGGGARTETRRTLATFGVA